MHVKPSSLCSYVWNNFLFPPKYYFAIFHCAVALFANAVFHWLFSCKTLSNDFPHTPEETTSTYFLHFPVEKNWWISISILWNGKRFAYAEGCIPTRPRLQRSHDAFSWCWKLIQGWNSIKKCSKLSEVNEPYLVEAARRIESCGNEAKAFSLVFSGFCKVSGVSLWRWPEVHLRRKVFRGSVSYEGLPFRPG